METTSISEAEFKVIDELARDKNLTQREISRRARISVGLVNLALKKLDILTPRGFSALTRRSYRFLRRTLRSLRVIKEQIQTLVLQEYQKGERNFLILADDDLADIIELSLQDLTKAHKDLKYSRASSKDKISTKDVIILVTDLGHRTPKYINILDFLTLDVGLDADSQTTP